MATVGLRNLVYAKLTQDDDTGVAYDAVNKISEAISATVTPTVNNATLYADDGAAETASALGEIAVSLNTKDLKKQVQADLLGHTVNGEGVLVKKSTDVAPYVAIGFMATKSNGEARYVWFYKGKFQLSEQTYNTKGSEISFQTPTINANFVKRQFDDEWQVEADSDDETITDATIFDTWFDTVYEETPAA